MQTILKMPAIDAIRAVQPYAKDQYLICDLPGLAEAARGLCERGGGSWRGNRSNAESAELIAHGDLSGVPASDAFLAKLESMVFVSRRFRVIDDVCGAVPNVPNYLAGVPCAMRRRVRSTAPSAPLAVFSDITSSAMIDAEQLRARGCAVLALVRLLSNLRPLELWITAGLGGKGEAHHIVTRIETSPLDLARAAHVLTCPSVSRGICYTLINERLKFSGGAWAYGDVGLERKHGAASLARVCNPGSQVLYIPAIHSRDQSVSDPVAWIKDKLAEYGGETVEQNSEVA
jgi:hypothetical protein